MCPCAAEINMTEAQNTTSETTIDGGPERTKMAGIRTMRYVVPTPSDSSIGGMDQGIAVEDLPRPSLRGSKLRRFNC